MQSPAPHLGRRQQDPAQEEPCSGPGLKIVERLAAIEHMGPPIQYPSRPPLMDAIWRKAEAAGVRLRNLYVLSRPLDPVTGGSHEGATGDIWVHYDPQNEAESARMLLHEIAHADRGHREPGTIDEDWDEEAAVFRRAAELARAWGFGHLVPDSILQEQLAGVAELRDDHHAAGRLAGSRHPFIARAAYRTLWVAFARMGQSDSRTFRDALWGLCADEKLNALAVDFDRTGFRNWTLTFNPGSNPADFGPVTLSQSDATAERLRGALARVADREPVPAPPAVAHVALESELDLERILGAALDRLTAYPDVSAQAEWSVFGSTPERGAAHLYRLQVTYGRKGQTVLWVLFRPYGRREVLAEAAFQRFIRGWLSATALYVHPIDEGVARFWHETVAQTG